MKIAEKLFKTRSDSFKKGRKICDFFIAIIKPIIRTALYHGCRVLGIIIQKQHGPAKAQPVDTPLLHQDERNVGREKTQVIAGGDTASQIRNMNCNTILIKQSNVHFNCYKLYSKNTKR